MGRRGERGGKKRKGFTGSVCIIIVACNLYIIINSLCYKYVPPRDVPVLPMGEVSINYRNYTTAPHSTSSRDTQFNDVKLYYINIILLHRIKCV